MLSAGSISIFSKGLHRTDFKNFIFFGCNKNYDSESDIKNFAKRNKGIVIQDDASAVKVLNDPFRSIPLYIVKNKNEDIIVFSNFDDLFSFSEIDRSIDIVGFWESVFYGGVLGTRTLFKNIKQMIGASQINIDKATKTFTIERYWAFDIYEDKSIKSMDQAATGLYDRLNVIFSKLQRDSSYVMGLSGGVDSRLTLAFLSRHIIKNKLKLFTYGYNKRILEYVYAKKVSRTLNFNNPQFHVLDENSYIKALHTLVLESCGQVGMGHCHTYNYLSENADVLSSYEHISTMYSDAILGWEAVYPKKTSKLADSSYFNVLEIELSKEIKDKIHDDVAKVLSNYMPACGFSSIEEFKYVTERNVKFHMYLSYLHSKYVRTLTPFANYDLLSYMISVPIQFRYQKRLSDYVLQKYFPEVSLAKIGNISSRCWWGPKFAGYLPYLEKGMLNRINTFLFRVSNGQYQLFDKYITEDWRDILHNRLYQKLQDLLETLSKYAIIDKKQKVYFSKFSVHVGGLGLAERFQIIGLAELIKLSKEANHHDVNNAHPHSW